MEYSEMQNKGFAIAERYDKKPLQEKINIIAETFGCKTGAIKTSPCTGKWRGTSDISLVFDNGCSLFIGNRRTAQAKTARVQNEYVGNTLAQYHPEIVQELKELATPGLLKREEKDNAVANKKGLKPYVFLNVELNDGSDQASGAYIMVDFLTLF